MIIHNSIQFSNYNNHGITFASASDITLEYVYKKHSKYLPVRISEKIKSILSDGQKNIPKLYELHNDLYSSLFKATSLEEVKNLYPEFRGIKELTSLGNNRSKALKAIKKIITPEKFTLNYLKKLYTPTSQDNLVREYGFTNRSLLAWLNKKLNIKKLDGSYIKLLKMSQEEENNRISELSRQAIYANPDVQKRRLAKAAETHRTCEYRAKKKQEMIDFYKRNPDVAKRTGLISKMTWDMCPEIKDAMSEYTRSLSPYVKKVLSKKLSGEPLTQEENRVTYGYYRKFWEQNPELRSLYKKRRIQVIEKLKKENII